MSATRTYFLSAICLLALVATGCGPQRPVLGIAEFPPVLPGSFAGMPVNGGRTISIAVHPFDPGTIVLSTQFGGLWKSTNRGTTWRHIDSLPAVSSQDVAWTPNGRRLIATVARDTSTVNGGGIWISNDAGGTWAKPATANPPAHVAVPSRGSAYGISFGRDRFVGSTTINSPAGDLRVYVGTDYGVAISADSGSNWRHVPLNATTPTVVASVLGLPGDSVLALSNTGVHRSTDGGATWTNIRAGDFARDIGVGGFKNLDVSPITSDAVLVLQDVSTLFLYNATTRTFRRIPTPAGGSRGPFVRVSRANPGRSIAIWVGTGVNLLRVRVGPAISDIEAIDATDWQMPAGLHPDSGHLGLDRNQRPILYGSDGGIFRPTNSDATTWENAADGRSGWNSLLITDLAGTNTQATGTELVGNALYFSTQDNAIWASSDGGLTWPTSDCAEGFHIEVRKDSPPSTPLQATYGKVGCGPSTFMYSDAHLLNQRAATDVDAAGQAVSGFGNTFLISPDLYIRTRMTPEGPWEIWVSSNNGANWRKRYNLEGIAPAGVFQCSAGRCYLPVSGGSTRIGVLLLTLPSRQSVTTLNTTSIKYLPDNGSLGVRATEFDWQAVFGVHATKFRTLLAPDVVNNVIRMSTDNGNTWTTNAGATERVTQFGTLMMYDDHPYRMQVTHVAFDPYKVGRILLGTRDAGVVASDDDGANWRTIFKSGPLQYATGFHFKRDDTVIASAYGRGLWVLDLRYRPRSLFGCPSLDCLVYAVNTKRRIELPFKTTDTITAVNGYITGAEVSRGRLRAISLSAGATMARFVDESKAIPLIEIKARVKRDGLRRMAPALKPNEGVKGFALEGDKLIAVIVGSEPFREGEQQNPVEEDETEDKDSPPTPPRPYVSVLNERNVSGMAVIGPGESIRIVAGGFVPGVPVRVLLDGQPLEAQPKVEQQGRVTYEYRDDGKLAYGRHQIEIVQGDLKAITMFLKSHVDEFEKSKPKYPIPN